MPSFTSSVEIDRPVGDVFAWFLDMDQNAPRVDPEADSVTKEPPGETAPGTVFTFRNGRRSFTVTFEALEPNHWIDFVTKLGPIRPIARLNFTSDGETTRVVLDGRANPVWPLRPLEGLANRRGKSEWDARLERIKRDLEANA